VSVVDASLLIDVIVGLPSGRPWRRWVADQEELASPDCVGIEVGRYLRRHTLRGALAPHDAEHCLEVFRELRVVAYPTGPLLAEAFALRDNVTFDDALYLALARALGEPLATTDRRLARAAEALGIDALLEPA
jgi:predicted nucleic acid-binding protein